MSHVLLVVAADASGSVRYMDWIFPPDVTFFALGLSMVITALGGFVKGSVGFAQPLVMISGMGIFLPAPLVVAGIVIPIVLANGLQVLRAGWSEALSSMREFWVYITVVCVMILLSAQFLPAISSRGLFSVLGVTVVVLCVIQLLGLRLSIPVSMRRQFSVGIGMIAGVLGGLTGTWGAPTVLYLLAVDTPKARQMAAQGVIYGIGAIALLIGHLQSGVLNHETIPFSTALVLPSLLGMWIGFRVQDRLDQERFRKMTLIVLTFAGLNLIRKGLLG